MTDHEKLVMRNIIYAVETGGQVYGQKDYADFTEAYTNSSAEHAITIGAGQWYGNEARTLLLKIKTTDAATFSKYDTAGVAADLNKTDWSNYHLSKTSAKAKAIVHIINSTVGHLCQDQLMDGQMETYVKEAASLGVTAMDAKMMCANFRHQGGLSAVKRILAKTTKPYTLDHLYREDKYKSSQKRPVLQKAPKLSTSGPSLLHFFFLHHVEFVLVGINKFVFQKTQTLIRNNFHTHGVFQFPFHTKGIKPLVYECCYVGMYVQSEFLHIVFVYQTVDLSLQIVGE